MTAPLVTLLDGRRVPSDSQEWRAESEAMMVALMPAGIRAGWLADVDGRRGDAGGRLLRANVERVLTSIDAEAASVLDIRSLPERRAAIEAIEHSRGRPYANQLRRAITAAWERSRCPA